VGNGLRVIFLVTVNAVNFQRDSHGAMVVIGFVD